jgi:hypothetical protein
MNGVLIVGVGTLGASVVRLMNERKLIRPYTRALAIDTHAAEELARVPTGQRCGIGDVPVGELYRRRKNYPWMENLPIEVLRGHPENMLNGGSKIRAATLLALQWASKEDGRLECAIRGSLAELREASMGSNGLRIFLVAGVTSTTGSGAVLEMGILLRRILADLGLSGSSVVTFLSIGSEGFEMPVERHQIEAAFWREFNALALGSEVPRPHDEVETMWAGRLPFDYTFYFSRLTRGWNFRSIDELAQALALWLAYVASEPDVAAHLEGMRGRHHAQVHDVNPVTGCPTCLSFSGMAAFDLNLHAVYGYGRADFGVRAAEALLGDPAPAIGPFRTQVQLQAGVIRVRLGYQPDQTRIDRAVTQLYRALLSSPPADWPGVASTVNLTLGRQLEEIRERLPAARREVTSEILSDLDRLHRQAASQVQLLGALKLLEDVHDQAEKTRREAGDQLGKLQNVDRIDTAVAAVLKNLTLWNKKATAEALRQLLLSRYVDALNALYLHEILRLLDDVIEWLDRRIEKTGNLCAALDVVRARFEQERREAPPAHETETVRFLTRQDQALQDYDELLAPIITEQTVEALKTELIASFSRERDVLALAACPPDALMERIGTIVEEQEWLEALWDTPFRPYWERAFRSRARQKQALEWLLSRSQPLGAVIAPGYAGQHGVVSPDTAQVSILLPEDIAADAEAILREIDPLLPAHAVLARPRFHKIVAVFEEAGYELRAKPHLTRIDAEYATLPPAARTRLATARWATVLPSYVPHEMFDGWKGSELLLLGMVAGAVHGSPTGFALRHREFDSVSLGPDVAAAEHQISNGYREEINAALASWLRSGPELKPAFDTARQRWPEREADLVSLFARTRRECAALADAVPAGA